jgi:hypothetical protein
MKLLKMPQFTSTDSTVTPPVTFCTFPLRPSVPRWTDVCMVKMRQTARELRNMAWKNSKYDVTELPKRQ